MLEGKHQCFFSKKKLYLFYLLLFIIYNISCPFLTYFQAAGIQRVNSAITNNRPIIFTGFKKKLLKESSKQQLFNSILTNVFFKF